MKLAFNARNMHHMGVERPEHAPMGVWTPEWCMKAFFMPIWWRNGISFHLRICGPHRITSGSVDPTGSPPTSTHSLLSSQSSSIPNKHSSLLTLYHSHPNTHFPSKFNISFPPNPTHMAEYTSPSISSISSSYSSILSSFARGRATF